MNLVQKLAERAAQSPDQLAMIEGVGLRQRALTFSELTAQVCAGSAELRRRGVGVGDWVMMLHPVSIDLYVAMLAAMRVGAVVMLVDPGAGVAGFRRAVKRHRPVAWSGHGKGVMMKWLVPELWSVPRARVMRRSEQNMEEADDALAEVGDEAPALVTFTSGSTGVPKAAVRSHGFLLRQNQVLGRSIALTPGEVDLVTMPVFALANLAHGVTSVLAAADTRDLAAQIPSEQVTRCAVSPAYLTEWLDAKLPLHRMKKIFTGGGPVFPSLLERVRKAVPDAELAAVYGSTEAEPIAHLEADEMTAEDIKAMRAGEGLLTGLPVAEIQLAIIRDQWGEPIPTQDAASFEAMRQPVGKAGEIVVTGDHVLSGYLDGVGDEETKFRVGGQVWHRTGDAGKLDARGRLWLLGRCTAVIRDARGEVYPIAIETQLSFYSWVRRCAVLEVDGVRLLVVETDATEKFENLSRPEGIDEIRRLDRIPVDRRHRAKIDYPALRAMKYSLFQV